MYTWRLISLSRNPDIFSVKSQNSFTVTIYGTDLSFVGHTQVNCTWTLHSTTMLHTNLSGKNASFPTTMIPLSGEPLISTINCHPRPCLILSSFCVPFHLVSLTGLPSAVGRYFTTVQIAAAYGCCPQAALFATVVPSKTDRTFLHTCCLSVWDSCV
jgi:hypothetical protein